jgi:hypothetical protein
MAERGGKRVGAGRKPVEDEKKVNEVISIALKSFYKVDSDSEAKEKLIHTLMESQRGQIFISEHLFGKPKETVESNITLNDFSIKDLVNIK